MWFDTYNIMIILTTKINFFEFRKKIYKHTYVNFQYKFCNIYKSVLLNRFIDVCCFPMDAFLISFGKIITNAVGEPIITLCSILDDLLFPVK